MAMRADVGMDSATSYMGVAVREAGPLPYRKYSAHTESSGMCQLFDKSDLHTDLRRNNLVSRK